MITNKTTVTYSEQYLLSRGISPETSIFFDIETTGFKAGYSHLYLIGAAFRCPDNQFADVSVWEVRQWMTERPQEEIQLLRIFAEFLKSYDTILHFNGNRFDIPYLEEKYDQYGLPSPFTGLTSVDLYQDFRPLKSFLRLDHMNQKSLELFLGLERDDKYDGGKLIPVYREFCKTGSSRLLKLLLLHNQEDVSGMFTLTQFYGYLDFFDLANPEHLSRIFAEVLENRDGTRSMLLTFPLKTPVPVPVSRRSEFSYLTINKSTGKLLLPMLEDTLYYFFSDYKNYYYLPQEDQAIHKSVAAYVEKEYRQPARKENCYTRQYGLFLPQTEELFTPAFRRSYGDTLSWFAWDDSFLQDTSRLSVYLGALLSGIVFPGKPSSTF